MGCTSLVVLTVLTVAYSLYVLAMTTIMLVIALRLLWPPIVSLRLLLQRP